MPFDTLEIRISLQKLLPIVHCFCWQFLGRKCDAVAIIEERQR
jgi:hypothetical protein